MPTSLREHEGVVQAILAGDAELTAQRLRDHVVVQGQRFADLVASLAELASGARAGDERPPQPQTSPKTRVAG